MNAHIFAEVTMEISFIVINCKSFQRKLEIEVAGSVPGGRLDLCASFFLPFTSTAYIR